MASDRDARGSAEPGRFVHANHGGGSIRRVARGGGGELTMHLVPTLRVGNARPDAPRPVNERCRTNSQFQIMDEIEPSAGRDAERPDLRSHAERGNERSYPHASNSQ